MAWLDATDPAVLRAGLAAVAEELGLADGHARQGGGDAGRAVRDWLERDGRRCLWWCSTTRWTRARYGGRLTAVCKNAAYVLRKRASRS